MGLRAGVDNSAHLGGLLAGVGLGAVFAKFLRADEDRRSGVRTLVAIGGRLIWLVDVVGIRREYNYSLHSAGAAKRKQADTFLAANQSKKGVKVLPDGLQSKVLSEGNGPKPTASDLVTVNYRGTLINGKEFDSSYKRGRPVSFRPNELIKGWIKKAGQKRCR